MRDKPLSRRHNPRSAINGTGGLRLTCVAVEVAWKTSKDALANKLIELSLTADAQPLRGGLPERGLVLVRQHGAGKHR